MVKCDRRLPGERIDCAAAQARNLSGRKIHPEKQSSFRITLRRSHEYFCKGDSLRADSCTRPGPSVPPLPRNREASARWLTRSFVTRSPGKFQAGTCLAPLLSRFSSMEIPSQSREVGSSRNLMQPCSMVFSSEPQAGRRTANRYRMKNKKTE